MRKEVLERAITTYGVHAQMDMATEECAELIQAINKLKRKTPKSVLDRNLSSGNKHLFCIPPHEHTDVAYSQAYFGLCSEVADVKIMLTQLEMILSKEAIDLSVERKIDRLEERLNSGK
jgi:hypothetical protein